jgi:Outer membrane protein beta-barrel domain
MQRVILGLVLGLGVAVPAIAQDRPRVTVGANYSFSPANGTAKDVADSLGAETGISQAIAASVDVRLFNVIGIGLRPSVYRATLLDNALEDRSRSFDISATAELSKRSDLSVLVLGGPTVFYETLEVLGDKLTETNLGFHVGGEVAYFFHPNVGAAGSVVFNNGGDGAGYSRIGAGVRFRF